MMMPRLKVEVFSPLFLRVSRQMVDWLRPGRWSPTDLRHRRLWMKFRQIFTSTIFFLQRFLTLLFFTLWHNRPHSNEIEWKIKGSDGWNMEISTRVLGVSILFAAALTRSCSTPYTFLVGCSVRLLTTDLVVLSNPNEYQSYRRC